MLSQAGDIEEGTSYSYPFFYDDADSFSDEDVSKLESMTDSSKDASSSAWHGKIGNAKVTVDVENTDFLSQCQAKWESKHKKKETEEGEKVWFLERCQ